MWIPVLNKFWKTFLEFLDDNKTYENFKDAILVHYPDAVYSIRDMGYSLVKDNISVLTRTTKSLYQSLPITLTQCDYESLTTQKC
jgi:hypothetical protein